MLFSLINLIFLILIISNLPISLSQHVDLNPRIVNGVTANKIIPYQASLRVSIRDRVLFGRGHTCGAVLIRFV